MFLLQSLITREQRPAERNVARRPGDCLHNIRYAARKRRGLERGFKSPEMLEFLTSAVLRRRIGYEIRRKSCISSLKSY